MTNEHPITPPPELVQQWWEEADQDCDRDDPKNYFDYIATQAARWGADQELWTPNYLPPKPPMTDPIRSLCAQPEPTVDDILLLAAIIREVDGGNRLGAAQLAEDILSHPASRWGRPTPQPDLTTRLALHPDGTPMVSIGQAAPLAELGRLAADPEHSRSVMGPAPEPAPEGLTDEELLELMPQQFRDDLATVSRLASYGTPVEPGIYRVSLNTGSLDFARAVEAAVLARHPTPQPPAMADVQYEWELQDAEGSWQAGGSANCLDDVEREGARYLQQYSQDGPHKLIIRQHCTETINEITND